MSTHEIRIPIKWPRLYRGHGIGPTTAKCGRYVRYWQSDLLAWMTAHEAASSRGGVQ